MGRRRAGLASTNTLLCCAERKTWQKEQWKKRCCTFPRLLFYVLQLIGRLLLGLVENHRFRVRLPVLSDSLLAAVLAPAVPELHRLPHLQKGL